MTKFWFDWPNLFAFLISHCAFRSIPCIHIKRNKFELFFRLLSSFVHSLISLFHCNYKHFLRFVCNLKRRDCLHFGIKLPTSFFLCFGVFVVCLLVYLLPPFSFAASFCLFFGHHPKSGSPHWSASIIQAATVCRFVRPLSAEQTTRARLDSLLVFSRSRHSFDRHHLVFGPVSCWSSVRQQSSETLLHQVKPTNNTFCRDFRHLKCLHSIPFGDFVPSSSITTGSPSHSIS